MLSRGLGELGASGAERVLDERRARLDAVHEPLGELRLLERERGAHERRAARRRSRGRRGSPDLLELDQQGVRLLLDAPGRAAAGPRPRTPCAYYCGWPLSRAVATSSSAAGVLLVRAPLGEQAKLHGAWLDGEDVAGRLQALRQRDRLGQRLLGQAAVGEEGQAHGGDHERELGDAAPLAEVDPLRQAARAACGPSYCQLATARLLWRTAAARPWPCSSASASARRMSSSPWRSPRAARAVPRKPSARAGSARPSSEASASARSAAAIASG